MEKGRRKVVTVLLLQTCHLGPTTTLKLMVWGCITFEGVGPLAFVDGSMNSVKYTETLEEHFLPFVADHTPAGRWYLLEDNASVHRSAHSESRKRQHGIPAFFCPPQSPDLNPIENEWLVIKNYV